MVAESLKVDLERLIQYMFVHIMGVQLEHVGSDSQKTKLFFPIVSAKARFISLDVIFKSPLLKLPEIFNVLFSLFLFNLLHHVFFSS